MNYLILNDEDSTNITGLLIQSLPPITKPLIRTSVEEIDGKDGDVITKLGYSAYDREVTIGLYGNYDIDSIIAFFNSEGKAVFSNEPDRYYKYTITEQIDFERLIRFKTATVTFHVQPFKYSSDEGIISGTTSISVTNNGNIYSRPKLTITGSGTVSVKLDNSQVFSVEMGDTSSTIIIDAEEMNAYDETGIFKNRAVTGDYDKFVLDAYKKYTIAASGSVTALKAENITRWI